MRVRNLQRRRLSGSCLRRLATKGSRQRKRRKLTIQVNTITGTEAYLFIFLTSQAPSLSVATYIFSIAPRSTTMKRAPWMTLHVFKCSSFPVRWHQNRPLHQQEPSGLLRSIIVLFLLERSHYQILSMEVAVMVERKPFGLPSMRSEMTWRH